MQSNDIQNKDVFISYRNDGSGNHFAHRLVADLEKVGYSVYFNPHEHRSHNFHQRLRDAIEHCKDFILILSQGCLDELKLNEPVDWVREEILMAHRAGKHIIPILLEGIEPPQSKDEMPDELQFLPLIDAIRFPEEYINSPFLDLMKVLNAQKNGSHPNRDTFNSNPTFDVDADFKQTLHAAQSGDVQAMYDLGMMYYYGVTTKEGKTSCRNYDEAYKWLYRVTETDSELRYHAYSTISRMYYAGSVPGEPHSFEKAYQYNVLAAPVDAYAAMNRAYMQRVGLGCRFDYNQIVISYEDAIEKGDTHAILSLANFHATHGRFQNAMELYDSLTYISPEADYRMGLLYRDGVLSNPPSPDYIYAGYHFQKAADNHHVMAAYEYGILCYRPTGRFHKNFPAAQKYLQIAADHGMAEAQYVLGFMYEKGLVELSMEKAIHYYSLAMQQGHSLASLELSKCYQEQGYQNYQLAYECAKLAASHGTAEAELILGNLLLWGRGCVSDVNRAIEMYTRALQHGMHYASIMLEKARKLQKTIHT